MGVVAREGNGAPRGASRVDVLAGGSGCGSARCPPVRGVCGEGGVSAKWARLAAMGRQFLQRTFTIFFQYDRISCC